MEATQEQVAVRMGDESKVGVVSPAFKYMYPAVHEAYFNGHNSFRCLLIVTKSSLDDVFLFIFGPVFD